MTPHIPVYINVYTLYVRGRPLVFPGGLGVFHSGVEILGKEWAFEGDRKGTGVWYQKPISPLPTSPFKCQIYVGLCIRTPQQVDQILNEISQEYPATSYNIVHRNCHDFSNDFSFRLCGSERYPLPKWLNTLAKIGRCTSPLLGCCIPFLSRPKKMPLKQVKFETIIPPSSNPKQLQAAEDMAREMHQATPSESSIEAAKVASSKSPQPFMTLLSPVFQENAPSPSLSAASSADVPLPV
ncbi:putative pppde peptidase family [Monocercomonoides exilis]|uniref:putative pppde peptidase family n=1 Tax=Monocercomonoides exilis TaxID=2049356 RepID=UPI0035599BC1|nr:putative pppde peptidase family [Monocercomonoides exilis]|eukprot:MONOS_9655.1-p1 / transcript=MONOS_9655.1 / gene=MONOS_9655 / organism=Monocercomonoides_exilis_PA203 / gene_product=hag1 / transcript_product=hag1 / location=Mono_scaffold00406:30287-31257(-) / protein_length=238 / sequence_SO=supercontig / SO=protein_coding / is_pseudo=false